VIPNAIAITTYRKEYIFRSFWDRDEAFNMLKDLVNKYKGIDTTPSSDPDGNMDMSISGPSTRVTSDSVVSLTTDSNVAPATMNRRNSASSVIPTEGGVASDQKPPRPVSMSAAPPTPVPMKQTNPPAAVASISAPPPAAIALSSESSQSKLKSADDNELDTGPSPLSLSDLPSPLPSLPPHTSQSLAVKS
jgi:hypothetical protein